MSGGDCILKREADISPLEAQVSAPSQTLEESSQQAPRLPGLAGVYPNPSDLIASMPPLPQGDSPGTVPETAGEKSRMTERFDKAIDVRQLSAHDVVPRLRLQLEEIFEPAGTAQEQLSNTVGNRVIIVHGPTGTGKSTVIPWEAMVRLEDYCSRRGRKVGRVICSQQRRKVTISLAEEVKRRHGEVGRTTVGYHVSRELR